METTEHIFLEFNKQVHEREILITNLNMSKSKLEVRELLQRSGVLFLPDYLVS